MSDTPRGPNWWQASNGKWYPHTSTPPPLPQRSNGGGKRFLVPLIVGVILLGGLWAVVANGGSGGGATDGGGSGQDASLSEPAPTSPTTTTPTTKYPTPTMPSAEKLAFSAAVSNNEYVSAEYGGTNLERLADRICNGAAKIGVVTIGPENGEDVARAAYTWRCPEKLVEFDASVVSIQQAREEAARQAAEASAAAEARAEAAREVGINAEEFARITTGMTYSEVESIVGSPGELASSTEIAGYRTEAYTWWGESGTGVGANAFVMFQNGGLISKSQSGL